MNLRAQRSKKLKAFIRPLVCLLVVACGQKGALYIPDTDQQPVVSPETLSEPGPAQPVSFPDAQELPAEEENGIPKQAGADEASETAPD